MNQAAMKQADLAQLTRRLADIPADFLAEPRIAEHGEIVLPALVGDLLRMHGWQPSPDDLTPFVGGPARTERNRLALTSIAVWLLADASFIAAQASSAALLDVLHQLVGEMAGLTAADGFVIDAERREELVRAVLARLGMLPLGETAAQAADRLAAISAVQRRALLAASRAAEKRAREVREALERQLAAESADKWTRE